MLFMSIYSVQQFPRPLNVRLEESPERTAARSNFYGRVGKRLFDLIASSVGLLLTFPIFVVCAVAVRLDSSGPVFFRQWRIGRQGKPFSIFKFRTMAHQPEKSGLKITAEGDCRITRVGKWLRKSKLDELPQLFNVLKGEMSLVGPRPEVPEYVVFYNAEQVRVLDVKPGITGPASLAYIDEEKVLAGHSDKEAFYIQRLMAQKLELDLSYCRRVSFVEDLKLIFGTVRRLFEPGEMQVNTSSASRQTYLVNK